MKTPSRVPIKLVCCIMLMALSPAMAKAVSYVPHSASEQSNVDAAFHKRQGATLFLFHGMTPDAARTLINQDFAVFREPATGCPTEQRQVGKIRIIKLSGSHHLDAVVLEGALVDGDVAYLGEGYGLIVLTKSWCEAPASNPDSNH